MRVSILGCGWLGFPLAKAFVADGHLVKGSTTNLDKLSQLRRASIQPFCLSLMPQPQGIGWDFFLETDTLIINIPPRLERSGSAFHPAQMRALVALLQQHSNLRRVVYISSTSVYPELNRTLSETDVTIPEHSAAPTLVEAEHLIQALPVPHLILRCGGLMGYERIPAKYVAGKQNLDTGNIPVNYVHRDDVIAVIQHLLPLTDLWNNTYNVVAPEHPSRRLVYETTAAAFGYQPPTFIDSAPSHSFKIIDSRKLIEQTGFVFKFPNPVLFSYSHSK
jgi:nucleoside-diphosphate-sugar epimerase